MSSKVFRSNILLFFESNCSLPIVSSEVCLLIESSEASSEVLSSEVIEFYLVSSEESFKALFFMSSEVSVLQHLFKLII